MRRIWWCATNTRRASRSSTRSRPAARRTYWVNDYVKVGLTTNTNEEGDAESSLDGADVTLRMSADSWFKVQGGRSEGLVSSAMYSDDGGFGFVNPRYRGLRPLRAPMRIAPT